MHQRRILKQASAAALSMLLSATSWSAEITQEFTRAFSGTGIQRIQLIFVVEGEGAKQYTIFAQGPSLTNEGVDASEVLADPQISLILNNTDTIASNDNWGDDSSAARTAEVAEFFGITLSAQDAAMVRNLEAGQYTVAVTSADGGTGVTRVGAADSTDIPSESVPPLPDVSEACSEALCATDSTLAAECQDRLDTCIVTEEINQDECLILALSICREGELF